MKKLLLTALIVNAMIWLLLGNIANAHHKKFDQVYKSYGYTAKGSENYRKLDTESHLIENDLSKLVDKQLKNNEKTGLVNYVYWENGKVLINKNNLTEEMIKNNGLLRSNSMGKSIASYVVGHAVCKGKIASINQSVSDWVIINNTLYANNSLLEVLNMTSGDHNMICLLYTSDAADE